MVGVLQRRVLVMVPRIILRGAIPIDSNIGGYGHCPLYGEVVSRVWSLLSFYLFIVSRLCLRCLMCLLVGVFVHLKVALQRLFSSRFCETCIFLRSWYYRRLPRYYRRSCAWYYRTQHGSNFLLPLEERYYRLECGTSARAVLPR